MHAESATHSDQPHPVFGLSSELSQQQPHYLGGSKECLIQPDNLASQFNVLRLVPNPRSGGHDHSSGEESENEVHSDGSSIASGSVTSAYSVPFNDRPFVEGTKEYVSQPSVPVNYAFGHTTASQPTAHHGVTSTYYTLTQALPQTISSTLAATTMQPSATSSLVQPTSLSAPGALSYSATQPATFVPPQSTHWPPSIASVNQLHQLSTVITPHSTSLFSLPGSPMLYTQTVTAQPMYYQLPQG